MERSDRFLSALERSATEAVSEQFPMRLELKGGEVLEGVPESIAADTSEVAPRDVPPDELHHYGPREVTITIDGTEVLGQEVRAFTLRLP